MAPASSKPAKQQPARARTPMPGTSQACDPNTNPDLSFASSSSGYISSQAEEASADETGSSQSEGAGHTLGSDSCFDSRDDEANQSHRSLAQFVVSDDSSQTEGWTSSSSSNATESVAPSPVGSPCKACAAKRFREDSPTDQSGPEAKKSGFGIAISG